jgi:hypothetical protein
MRFWRISSLLCVALGISACSENSAHLQSFYLDQFADQNPTLSNFTVCHGFSCTERSPAHLSNEDWRKVTAVFKPRAKDARAERQQIARAVALIENIVGPQTGTNAHQWTHVKMYVIPNKGDPTQLDCIDSSVNTWTYMTLMERGKLFTFHRVAPLSYGPLRNTAVLQEINGSNYAIDASLVDIGVPPPTMPLTAWLEGWPPDPRVIETTVQADSKAGKRRS